MDKAGGITNLNTHRNARNCIEDEFPDERHKCPFCLNCGHNERSCNIKKQATCNKCGKVGFADSEGFAQASGRNKVKQVVGVSVLVVPRHLCHKGSRG